ncbi:hypothetical protein F5141DRAFT_1211693 [Pisolithus sp. B1]|nr:hypothetical protein F5141DRAFT_1211693 [Pisolithus sp. B1]
MSSMLFGDGMGGAASSAFSTLCRFAMSLLTASSPPPPVSSALSGSFGGLSQCVSSSSTHHLHYPPNPFKEY